MNGVLVIDKVVGLIFYDVVVFVCWFFKIKKVGYMGIFDFVVIGVFLFVFGKVIKVARFLSSASKFYHVVVWFGIIIDMFDVVGEVFEEKEVNVECVSVEAEFEVFRGEIDQIPPMYLVKKMDGKCFYELVCSGIEVEWPVKRVTILNLDLFGFDGFDIEFDVICLAGMYMWVLV